MAELQSKEEMWEKCFEIMVSSQGRYSIKDIKKVVAFWDTLSPEEQNRFDNEVAAECRRQQEQVFGETDDVRPDGGDGDPENSEGDKEVEVIATFQDIERMNVVMNRALSLYGSAGRECSGPMDGRRHGSRDRM
uniref:Protein m29.1 n=1 Tax=Mastomys natalensis cytomegalovirus 2 TaxID=2973540 RepID=A0A9Y1N6R5_9BETA|nr:protein m29.1 [Mastomys natalensis cytomegalovirus 2]WEG69171.1 protein m29.1 [Mastomys natalensis cytomegalovirus 2]WEG69310.1 protein m29.1 [Mastomys natalensis cytomegalovirus 2]WEG69448.1 protein m29.1 [Mastomys natalensis cytomegalovirus 2]WEG69586.1 protein m29.1 [Mastomys natalensis cytomegalovirus 2]